jgi:hypothetical protein
MFAGALMVRFHMKSGNGVRAIENRPETSRAPDVASHRESKSGSV